MICSLGISHHSLEQRLLRSDVSSFLSTSSNAQSDHRQKEPLTIDVVALNEAPSSLAHHHSIRIAMTDEVIAQDWIPSSADICTTPLILPYHILY